MAETTYGWTPYRYAFNNPLRFIDPDGLTEEDGVDIGYGVKSFSAGVTYLMGGPTPTQSQNPQFEWSYSFPTTENGSSNHVEANSDPVAGGVAQSTGDGLKNTIDWLVDPLSNLTITGAGLKYTSSNLLRDGYWLGKNGNYYSLTLTQKGSQGWNFYKNSADMASGSVKWLGRFGNTLGYLSTAYNGYNFVTNPNWESGIETTVGLGSIFFWEVGAIYYPIKLMYKSAEHNATENMKRGIDPFWVLRIMK